MSVHQAGHELGVEAVERGWRLAGVGEECEDLRSGVGQGVVSAGGLPPISSVPYRRQREEETGGLK
jgi:hypothetical protein